MKTYRCSVRLGDSTQHVVAKKAVTIPEIAVLKRVHGQGAVTIHGPGEPVDRSDGDERERLRKFYDRATPDSEPIVDAIFNPMQLLPQTLREIGVDPAAAAAELRAQAEAMAAAAAQLGEEDAPLEPTADEDDFFDHPEIEAPAPSRSKQAA